MVRYISLLLFIGLAWGQDVLVAVDGKEHKGKLLEQEEEYLFFYLMVQSKHKNSP